MTKKEAAIWVLFLGLLVVVVLYTDPLDRVSHFSRDKWIAIGWVMLVSVLWGLIRFLGKAR